MRKLFLLFIPISFLLIYFGCQQIPTEPEDTGSLFSTGHAFFDLYAGQNILVGNVEVWDDGTNLYVQFNITEPGWCLEETHLAVAEELSGIPQKNGNPIPGQFPYKHEELGCVSTDPYTIPLSEIGNDLCGEDIIIAAHAVVKDNSCELNGVVYGMHRYTGDVYEIDVVLGTASLSFSSVAPPPGSATPNGLAYDGANQRMYYCNYRTGADPRELYFYDYNTTTEHTAGIIGAENAAADFYNGKYYYISSFPATDDLFEVILNADGTIASQSSVDISGNAHRWTFNGDIAIKEGILYGWGSCAVHNTYEFFTYDLFTTVFNLYNVTYQASLQLAFGTDGTLYGHRSGGSGYFYEIDVTDGSVSGETSITPGNLYTDCASGILCIPGDDETAWGGTGEFPGKNWARYITYTVTCGASTGCTGETAWGGNTLGGGNAWWYYFDTQGPAIQNIYAGQQLMDGGSVEWDGTNLIITLGPNWSLVDGSETVKVQGYADGELPTSRPPAGQFTYKGTSLIVPGDGFRYYAIHLDVQECLP